MPTVFCASENKNPEAQVFLCSGQIILIIRGATRIQRKAPFSVQVYARPITVSAVEAYSHTLSVRPRKSIRSHSRTALTPTSALCNVKQKSYYSPSQVYMVIVALFFWFVNSFFENYLSVIIRSEPCLTSTVARPLVKWLETARGKSGESVTSHAE